MDLHKVEYVLRKFEERAAATSEAEMRRRRDAGEFHYIPLGIEQFGAMLEYGLRQLDPGCYSFVDVGCGVGTKVLLAQGYHSTKKGSYQIQAHGIERDSKYAKTARELCGADRIIRANALTANYSKYDIIYFFRPLYDPDKQTRLEKQIIKTCHKGTIILPIGNTHESHWKPLRRVLQNGLDYGCAYIKE